MSRIQKLRTIVFALATLPCAGAFAADACSVSLSQDPLVMRLGKDEFRIAFGLDTQACKDTGCAGTIKYRTTWETEDGTRSTEQKAVTFAVPDGAQRSLSVDRSYFDSGEGQHTTKVVSVDVAEISCGGASGNGLVSR